MAGKAEEYITPDSHVTNNVVEGYHGIVLAYRNKRIDLAATHYVCKTNMSIPHKVNSHPCLQVVLNSFKFGTFEKFF